MVSLFFVALTSLVFDFFLVKDCIIEADGGFVHEIKAINISMVPTLTVHMTTQGGWRCSVCTDHRTEHRKPDSSTAYRICVESKSGNYTAAD